MAICPAAAGRTGSAPGDSPPAWLTAQPCASLLRDSLHRHLGCVMSEPEAGPAARRQRRYTTPVKLLPTAGTAALRQTTRTLGHRRLNIHTSQSCTENARTCRRQRRCSGAEAVLVAVPGGSVAYVPGAVTGSNPKPSSTAPACPAPCCRTGCLQLRTSRALPQPGGQKSASWPTVLTLTALDWPAIILRQRKG